MSADSVASLLPSDPWLCQSYHSLVSSVSRDLSSLYYCTNGTNTVPTVQQCTCCLWTLPFIAAAMQPFHTAHCVYQRRISWWCPLFHPRAAGTRVARRFLLAVAVGRTQKRMCHCCWRPTPNSCLDPMSECPQILTKPVAVLQQPADRLVALFPLGFSSRLS